MPIKDYTKGDIVELNGLRGTVTYVDDFGAVVQVVAVNIVVRENMENADLKLVEKFDAAKNN